MDFIRVSDIVEANGKTIKENNMEKTHNLKVGDLVEVKHDRWHGDGACEKIHARLWVTLCGRDCDGTPLYWLSRVPKDQWEPVNLIFPDSGFQFKSDISQSIHYGQVGGFGEESLTKVEVTDRLKQGYDSLTWKG